MMGRIDRSREELDQDVGSYEWIGLSFLLVDVVGVF